MTGYIIYNGSYFDIRDTVYTFVFAAMVFLHRSTIKAKKAKSLLR